MSEDTSQLQQHASVAAPSLEGASVLTRPFTLPAATDAGRALTLIGVLAIVVLGAYLRFTHLNWDQDHLHPDERFLMQVTSEIDTPSSPLNYFDTDTSKLSPYNIDKGGGQKQNDFAYGTLPLFLNKTVAEWLDKDKHIDADGTQTFESHRSAFVFRWAFDTVTPGDTDGGCYDASHDVNLCTGRGGLTFDGGYDSEPVGRALSGLFDLGTVFFVFLIGMRLANRNVGLLAAFLYAVAPFPIQNSHFFIVDPFMTFFASFTLYFAIRSAQAGHWWQFVLAGAGAGFATACKLTAIALLPVVVLAIGVRVWPDVLPFVSHWWDGDRKRNAARRDGRKLDSAILTFIAGSLVALLSAFIAFRVAMPYAFKSPDVLDLLVLNVHTFGPLGLLFVVYPDIFNEHWLKDMQHQQELLSGGGFPPNWQWVGRSKWLWPAQQMISWGMGPALGVTAWLGVLFATIYTARKAAWVWLVPLAWVLGYFAVMGNQYSLYMRYFLPLYPMLTVFAAFLIHSAVQWATGTPFAGWGRLGERLAPSQPLVANAMRLAAGAVVVLTLAAGLAFYSIYERPHSRVEASLWMFDNVPAGSVIGHEHWDDTVPFRPANAVGLEPAEYQHATFDNFEIDDQSHVDGLLTKLDEVDYIALASRRLSGTIPRVPARWPVGARFYETLDTGELGFEKVKEFNSYPEIFGLKFNDTGSEESFSVYDHPKVVLYKKTDAYSRNHAVEVLGADSYIEPVNAEPKDLGSNAIRFRADVIDDVKSGGTWSDIYDPSSVFNDHPLAFWLITMEVAALALVPLALVVFRALPDRGYLLTKPLGILGLSYLSYFPAAHGIAMFTRGEIAIALGVMVAVGAAAGWRWRDEVRTFVRERWRFMLLCEAVFLGMFLFSYWMRLQNPDLFHPFEGGEKPMDFAYFLGVARSEDLTQGPVDPWHAGGYLNYYWWGFFIASVPTKLLGIVPEVAYNLVVPMFYALSAAATFSVAYNLTEATRRLLRRRADRKPISIRGPIIAALLAVFLVLVAGNLKAVDILVCKHEPCSESTSSDMTGISPWHSDIPVVGGAVVLVGGFKEIIFGDATLARVSHEYDWWGPSRALTIIPKPENSVTPITEWPFWTFLFADLHAHLMSIPFALTAVGVALGAVLNFSRLNPLIAAGRKIPLETHVTSWVMVLLMALIVGALRWINTWDFPPFLMLGATGLLLGERAREGRFNLRVLTIAGVKSAVMAIFTLVFFSVVAKNYSTSYGSLYQSNQTTDLTDYLSHFGVLVTLVLTFVMFMLARGVLREPIQRTVFFGRARKRRAIDVAPVIVAMLVAGAALVFAGTMQRWGVTALSGVGLIAVLLCALRELRNPSPTAPVLLFVYGLVALGFGLSGGPELITLEGDVGRANTVFKFYLHVWLVWGIASAYGAWYIFAVMRPHEAFMQRAGELNRALVQAPRIAFAAVATVLLVLTLVYPYFGTRARINNRFDLQYTQSATNDGLAFLDEVEFYDNTNDAGTGGRHELRYTRDGINWLRENVRGTPTTIEAVGVSYRSLGSRVAIYTGLPTVQGWDFHQEQQRVKFSGTIDLRIADITEFYNTTDVGRARQILKKYDVEWVILGDEERFNYNEEGLPKFAGGLDGAIELAYENPGMQIFHVIPDNDLSGGSTAARP